MEQTFPSEVLIINRQAFREYDSKICVYSRDKGRMDLIARGTSHFKSKLAGHIEPISMARIMVVKGKKYDYLASAQMTDSFAFLKEELTLLLEAGQAMNLMQRSIKASEVDERIYDLSYAYLSFINQVKPRDSKKFLLAFYLKFLALLGYQLQLESCTICQKAGENQDYFFRKESGGLICKACYQSNDILLEGEDLHSLRVMSDDDFFEIDRLNSNSEKLEKIVKSYLVYNLELDLLD